MNKIKKEYLVNVDMRWSINYEVKACSETEAKRLAWEKFKKNLPKKCFEILEDRKELNMEYSKTGRFTANQEKLAKEIAIRIAKLRKSGCYVFGNGDRLHVYKIRDIEHEQPLHLTTSSDYNHPLKYLEAGHINDSGAGDILFFEPGYITEE